MHHVQGQQSSRSRAAGLHRACAGVETGNPGETGLLAALFILVTPEQSEGDNKACPAAACGRGCKLPCAGADWYEPLRPHLMSKVHHVAGGVHQRGQQPQRAQQAVEGDAVIKGHYDAQGRLAQPCHCVAADRQQDQSKDDLVGLQAGPAESCPLSSWALCSWAVQGAVLHLAEDVGT